MSNKTTTNPEKESKFRLLPASTEYALRTLPAITTPRISLSNHGAQIGIIDISQTLDPVSNVEQISLWLIVSGSAVRPDGRTLLARE